MLRFIRRFIRAYRKVKADEEWERWVEDRIRGFRLNTNQTHDDDASRGYNG